METLGSLLGYSGVTLRVPWGHFGGSPGVTWKVLRGYFVGTLVSIREYSEITLEVLSGHIEDTLGSH